MISFRGFLLGFGIGATAIAVIAQSGPLLAVGGLAFFAAWLVEMGRIR